MIQSKNLDKKEEEKQKKYDISCKALLYLAIGMIVVFITSIFLV